jgi:beta-galactosidase/beta-glucuronidase
MHDMVKRDRSHPSVVIWSFCNEHPQRESNPQSPGLARLAC